MDLEPSLRDGFEVMLGELEGNRLEVVLVPSRRSDRRDWDMIRVPLTQNCEWYRRFCAKHASDRVRRNTAFDTRIRRMNTVRVLRRLLDGKPTTSKYAKELTKIAEKTARSLANAPF